MISGPQVATAHSESSCRTPFLQEVCLPFLLEAQNADGGLGHRAGLRSSVEPTCWALLALASLSNSGELSKSARSAGGWLLQVQLQDGSWPSSQGQQEGSWVTALACLGLHTNGVAPQAVARGVAWLCNTWPGEGGLWWRFRHWFLRKSVAVTQNYSFRGWSWTPGTCSWVEPTSYALILLRNLPGELHPRRATLRQRLGEAMLYDRMCPTGGWNCGNPLVYGVAGEPQVGPTVWALLALQDYRDRLANQKSLEWLEQAYEGLQGPGSVTLAHLCLETYGRPTPPLEPALQRFYAANQFFHSVPVMAWAVAALSPTRQWLRPARQGAAE